MPLPDDLPPAAAEQPLLERSDVLDAWAAALANARDGHGSALFVDGAPGLGKSAVLEHCARLAEQAGALVLRATAGELEREFDFGGIHQLLDDLVRGWGDIESGARLAGPAAPARALWSNDSNDAPAATGEARVVHALFRMVADLTDERVVVVVMDDAHWIDEPTVAWLTYVARRAAGLPIALVIAARPTERDDLGGLRAQCSTTTLAPLSRAAVASLSADPEALFAASGGNPFLISEALHALAQYPDSSVTELLSDVDGAAPESIVAWLRARLRALSTAAQSLAAAAAIMPRSESIAVVARIASLERQEAVAALAELQRAHVLRTGYGVEFLHPFVRSAAHAQVRSDERSELHRRAVGVLRERNASATDTAAHLLHVAPEGDTAWSELLDAAARHALRSGSPKRAVAFARRAVDEAAILDHATDTAYRTTYAHALDLAGSAEAPAAYADAIERAPDAATRIELRQQAARACFGRALFAEACELFDEARAELGRSPNLLATHPALELELDAGWASSAIFSPRMTEPDTVERVTGLVARSLQPTTTAQRVAIAHMAALQMLVARDRATTSDLAARAWGNGTLLRDAGPTEPALWAVTAAAIGCGDHELVDAVVEHTAQVAVQDGAPIPFATARFVGANLRFARGQLSEAHSDIERALELGRELDRSGEWGTFQPAAQGILSNVLLQLGDVDGAEAALDLQPEQEAMWRGTLVYLPVVAARARIAFERGDAAAALALWHDWNELSTGLLGMSMNSAYIGGWRPGAIDALLRLDRGEEALVLAREELDATAAWGDPGAEGRARHALAKCRGRDGADELRRAIALLEDGRAELDAIAARIDLGSVLRANGQRSEARAVLLAALDESARLGAVLLRERADGELRVLGMRPRQSRTTGLESLTATERRVVELAASGIGNRQIAERLFVTVHAIRYHLRNSYAKLGVSDRAALAALLGDGASSVD